MNIDPKQVARVLAVLIVCLAAVGGFADFSRRPIRDSSVALSRVVAKFRLDGEGTVPAWYSSLALFACCVLFAVIARSNERKRPRTGHWAVLSVIFLFLSLDEAVSFHELVSRTLKDRIHTRGLFYFAWVIPGIALTAAFAGAFIGFLAALDRRHRLLFITAGLTYVAGALGMEMVGGAFADWYGKAQLRYQASALLEETLEMLGIGMLLYTLLSYLSTYVGTIQVSFSTRNRLSGGARCANPGETL